VHVIFGEVDRDATQSWGRQFDSLCNVLAESLNDEQFDKDYAGIDAGLAKLFLSDGWWTLTRPSSSHLTSASSSFVR
jgi:hypothetical protein